MSRRCAGRRPSTRVLAGGLEKFATDIRHLQRSEVAEVRERFAALGVDPVGSSPEEFGQLGAEVGVCGPATLLPPAPSVRYSKAMPLVRLVYLRNTLTSPVFGA
mgnify:CR=1 FL=1